MSRFVANRLAEIRHHLGDRLAEMKLKPRAKNDYPKDRFFIEFVPSRSGGDRSPIKIYFANEKESGLREASWEHAELQVDVWARRELGETGWVSWKEVDIATHRLRGTGEKMFEWLSFVLDYNGVVPPIMHSTNCIANPKFGDIYLEVERWADFEISQEYEYPGSPIEHLRFTDARDREVHIPVRKGNSHYSVFVEGKQIARVVQEDLVTINNIVRDLCLHPMPRSKPGEVGLADKTTSSRGIPGR